MKFYKYCGAGNDFVLLENFDGALTDYPALAKRLCDRHFSVGADGLIVLEPAQHGADCRMRFYNNDGSAAEMCGNGVRCLCRHCYERGLSGETQRIETPAGLVTGQRIDADHYRIELNTPSVVRLQMVAEDVLCDYLVLGESGIPHAVAPMPELTGATLKDFAARLRFSTAFPGGANVNLWRKTGDNALYLRTYERGVEDFTLACGTGAGSTAAAMRLRGELGNETLTLDFPGGELQVSLSVEDDTVCDIYLTGPAIVVAEGKYIGA